MIEVTCAVIQKEKKVLICQRSEVMKLSLKWEFPGGKVEDSETHEQCIIREIKEELNLDIDIIRPLMQVKHHYEKFSICLIPFLCRLKGGELKLKEHKRAIWVEKSNLKGFDWAEADLPIVEGLISSDI